MKQKETGVCLVCGKEFIKTRPNKRFCSRNCACYVANKRAKARKNGEVLECGSDCVYNNALVCTKRKCDSCGWNPTVAKQRSARYGKTGN